MVNPLIKLKYEIHNELLHSLINNGCFVSEEFNFKYNETLSCFSSSYLFNLDRSLRLKMINTLHNKEYSFFYVFIQNNHINIHLKEEAVRNITKDILKYILIKRTPCTIAYIDFFYKNKSSLADFRYVKVKKSLSNIMSFYGYTLKETFHKTKTLNRELSFKITSPNISFEDVITSSYIDPLLYEKFSENFLSLAILKKPYNRVLSYNEADLLLNIKNNVYVTAYVLARTEKLYSRHNNCAIKAIDYKLCFYAIRLAAILNDSNLLLSVSPLANLLIDYCNKLFEDKLYLDPNVAQFSSCLFYFITNILETYFESY